MHYRSRIDQAVEALQRGSEDFLQYIIACTYIETELSEAIREIERDERLPARWKQVIIKTMKKKAGVPEEDSEKHGAHC